MPPRTLDGVAEHPQVAIHETFFHVSPLRIFHTVFLDTEYSRPIDDSERPALVPSRMARTSLGVSFATFPLWTLTA